MKLKDEILESPFAYVEIPHINKWCTGGRFIKQNYFQKRKFNKENTLIELFEKCAMAHLAV